MDELNARGILLPFPLTEESETYSGIGGELIKGFTDLKEGLHKGYSAYINRES